MFFCISSVLYLILNCCCYYILIGHIGLHWRSRHEYVREAVTPAGGIPRGESQNWTEWAEHFESVATVNKWDSDDDKLKWQRGRPFESSRQTFETNTYGEYVKALKLRF